MAHTSDKDNEILPYIYTALTPGPESQNRIRILTLSPGIGDDIPRASLREIDIYSRTEKYEALSYTWGPPIFDETLICDELSIKITQSLYTALLYLRDPDQPRELWIDAVCINQADILERNAQVQLMHKIYGEAGRVIIWLGDHQESDSIPAVIEQLEDLNGRVEAAQSRESHDLDFELLDFAFEEKLDPSSELSLPLRKFLGRPWFTRMWILQEITCARSAIAMVGNQEIYWSTIAGACTYLSLYPESKSGWIDTSFMEAMNIIDSAAGGLLERDRETYLGLFDILKLIHRKGNATDPRDHIFALLNVSKDGWLPKLQPDYSPLNTVEAVYAKTAAALINHHKDLSVLQLAEDKHELSDSLPSWAPDWRKSIESGTSRPRNSLCVASKRGERYQTGLACKAVTIATEDIRVLSIVGLTIAPISHIFDPLQGDPTTADSWPILVYPDLSFEVVFPYAPEFPASFAGSSYKPTSELLGKAYARTLTADLWYTSSRHESDPGASFKRLYISSTHKLMKLAFEKFPEATLRDIVTNHFFTDESMATIIKTEFLNLARSMLIGRRVFLCEIGGYMGLGPKNMRVGDDVCLALGSDVPLVIRYNGGEDTSVGSTLVGEAYMHGVMDGEVMTHAMDDTNVAWVKFDLH